MADVREPELSLRRRAALAALSADLSGDALIDALWLLQRQYAAQSVTRLIAYVNAVADRFHLDQARRKALYLDLFKFINHTPEAQLPADPWPMMNGGAGASPAPAEGPKRPPSVVRAVATDPDLIAKQRIFHALARFIMQRLQSCGEAERAEFDATLNDSLGRITGLGGDREAVHQWLIAGAENVPPERFSDSQMQAIVHTVLIALCMALGRLAADDLLSAAVEAAGRLPEAAYYSPEKLL